MKAETLTCNPEETKKLGQLLAKKILKAPLGKKAFVLGLKGDLGGGKTTFLQGFASGLRVKEKITSPTFVLIKKYKIQNTRYKIQNFFHIDCYRIEKPRELTALGFREIIAAPQNIVAVEWADRVGKIMPKSATWINFQFKDKEKREIVINFK